MTCRELVEMLFDYISGELAPDQALQIRQHLDLCRPCVTYIQTYQITIRLSRQLPKAPVPADLLARMRRVLEDLEREFGP